MKLGPESRRRVGDNYENIIFQLLQNFGWRVVSKNFEIDVPKKVRTSKQQGADGTFLYFDPLWNSDIGVYVESKKCKDITTFKYELPKWLKIVDDAIRYSNEGLFHHPFTELSESGHVSVQEGLLSVWIDEEAPESKIRLITKGGIEKHLEEPGTSIDLNVIVVMTNLRLLQLQAVTDQLWKLIGKYHLPGYYRFEYPKRGAFDAPKHYDAIQRLFFYSGIGRSIQQQVSFSSISLRREFQTTNKPLYFYGYRNIWFTY